MEENYDLLDELDRWFAAYEASCPELTEEEIEAIERGADSWLMGLWDL